jgi:uncharacterized membrane protein YdjX (TVP38/TMEM64 family)
MSKKTIQRISIVLGVVALIVVFKILGLERYFSLSYLKSSQESFATLYSQHQAVVIGAYMLIYIVVTALSLPGAAVLTLAGGALFGFVVGTVVVSFASTIGATLACFVSRFLLREWVQKKFGDKLQFRERWFTSMRAKNWLRLIPYQESYHPVFSFLSPSWVCSLSQSRN